MNKNNNIKIQQKLIKNVSQQTVLFKDIRSDLLNNQRKLRTTVVVLAVFT